MKRTPLRSMSRMKALERDARRRCMEIVVRRDRICRAAGIVRDIGCNGPLDGHEPLPRSRGGDPTDPEQVILVCRQHHDWIHAHPEASYGYGLLIRTTHNQGAN